MVFLELQQRTAGNEISLSRLRHFGSNFVRAVRNDRIEAKNVAARLRDFCENRFASEGTGGKLGLSRPEHKDPTRLQKRTSYRSTIIKNRPRKKGGREAI